MMQSTTRFFPARSKKTVFFAAIFILTFSLSALSQTLDDKPRWEFMDFFRYDKDVPFNLEEKIAKDTDLYTLYLWHFDSIHDKRVSAEFSVPKGVKGPVPVFIFIPGFPGSKEDINRALDMISKMGYACLALDPEYSGERKVEGKAMYSKLMFASRDAMVQTHVDHIRAIDLVTTRPEVDPKRIGLVGASMGGIFGGVLMAVEPRIRAAGLAVGGANWAYLLKASIVADALGLKKGEHKMDPAVFATVIGPVDPINWAQLISPRPVLMLNATHDVLVNPEANKMLFARLKAPKKIVWFDSGHELPFDIAIQQMVDFFNAYVKGDEDPSKLGAVVEGYETKPLDMTLKKPLPPILTDMPVKDIFQYDTFLDLKTRKEPAQISGCPNAFRVSFQSIHDQIVPATLCLPGPEDKGPYPAVVYVHELFSDRGEVKDLIPELVKNGYAVLAPDLEYSGERASDISQIISQYIYRSRDAVMQSLFDIFRSVDFLEAENWIKADRVFLLTKGSGAYFSIMAGAFDPRIRGAIITPGARDKEFCDKTQQCLLSRISFFGTLDDKIFGPDYGLFMTEMLNSLPANYFHVAGKDTSFTFLSSIKDYTQSGSVAEALGKL